MRKLKRKHGFRAGLGILCLLCSVTAARSAALDAARLRRSAIKIHVTTQQYDYFLPWQSGHLSKGNGTGFAIGQRRILTNAHIVSNARFLQVQKDGDPRRYPARVTYVAHDCDLATLTVDDDAFFDTLAPLTFADAMPDLNDEVTVLGFPMGGDRLSVTRGVVSRIDYTGYAHSGADQHLVMQVDAAINPGNSGGPILYGGNVVGVAFQGLSLGDNIGYAIPLPVIEHFLNDIRDAAYNGYPELGVAFLTTRNPALRQHLALADRNGVAVKRVDPYGAARHQLRAGDVLLAIDGHSIANDGTIQLPDGVVIFPEIIERKQWGDEIQLRIWRNRQELELRIPLTNPHDPFVFRNEYDTLPRYYLYGGLVFTPLTREHLKRLANGNDPNVQQLHYYAQFAKIDGLHEGLHEFVVLMNRLPHSVNTYAARFEQGIVTSVNGMKITNLMDVKIAIDQRDSGFHIVRFAGMEDTLVLDADTVNAANPTIMAAYGVPSAERLTRVVPTVGEETAP